MKNKRIITVIILTAIMILSGTASAVIAFADGGNTSRSDYYVAFSHQNYSIKNSNKMILGDDGNFYLEKVSLTSAIKFYVTDNKGVRYYSSRGENMEVDEAQAYRYNIKFSPDNIYDESVNGYKATNCHITYSFYTPETYSVNIGGTPCEPKYNPYFTAYDLYCISSVKIESGTVVSYGGETHTVDDGGTYRILFTPTVERDGKEYAFDVDGRYGSGEDYIYNLYIEDAAEYFVVFNDGATSFTVKPSTQIDGKDAYALTRYEQNTGAEEFRFGELFIAERDTALKYAVYEQEITGGYRLIDDDNDGDTNISKIIVSDAGWYELSLTVGAENYRTSVQECERLLDGYYIAGGFNGYGYNEAGGVDVDKKFCFTKVEEDDEDYNDDYEQYILRLTVTKKDVADENLEFYITDGKDKYKNGGEYISLNTAGEYKILFSDEHVYSQGRHYRYTLQGESQTDREIEISTAADFISFAENCSKSADYSENLSAYLICDLDFSGVKFVSIKTFNGKFFGGYHTLKNIEINDDKDCLAVFETVTRTGSIERLNIENLSLQGKNCEYVGFIAKNYGTVKKVSVGGEITGDNYVGGVAAFNGVSRIDDNSASLDSNNIVQTGVLQDCTNSAAVTGKSNAGGVVGFNSGDVISCINNGTVAPDTQTKSNLMNFGGVAGFSAGKLSDCTNNGAVGRNAYSVYVGGVIGFGTGENYFCVNSGEVSGRKYVGGIIGGYGNVSQNQNDNNDLFGGLDYAEIINKYFNTDDTGDEVLIGARHNLVYLQNYGDISADNYAGGVVGNSVFDGLIIRNSFSVGNIVCKSGGYLGGILGNGNISVVGCFSFGTLKASGAGANYAGGIVGNGGNVQNCMSCATVFGSDYVGGIAGNITGYISSSYSNTNLVFGDGSRNVGGIAGFAESFNASLNLFPAEFKYNYYIGNSGGIGRTEYAQNYEYAATGISAEKLLSENNLSAYLHEFFNHAYWQGGKVNSYPVLTYMYECFEIGDIDDETELFIKHADRMQSAMEDSAKLTYRVVFMEWNKDNGELYDDGKLQYDNFEEIYSVRVEKGASVESVALKYAEFKNGRWIYEGTDKIYFVSLKPVTDVQGNIIVYAEYTQTISTLSDESGNVLAEGVFDAKTQISLERTGDYYFIKFTLNGEEINVTQYTVKFRKPSADADYSVYAVDRDRTQLNATEYGEYICFELNGGLFEIYENTPFKLSVLEIVLISVLSATVAGGIVACTVIFIKKSKKTK